MISPCLGKKNALLGQLNRPLWASNSPLVGKKVALFWGKNIVLFWTRKWMALMLPRSQIALNEQNCHSLYL